jgi:hypothetical protein
MDLIANAKPTKRFFISNLTRDLSLEDAILDLVDNSADAYIRTRNIDVSQNLLRDRIPIGEKLPAQSAISVSVSEEGFSIVDRCGGIDLEHAINSVFRFGRPDGSYSSSLGVYGIGLKRAIFKIGRKIRVESRTADSGFRLEIDVPAWAADDENWEFPLERIDPAENAESAGTSIIITDLTPEVILRINDGTLLKRVGDFLAVTYSLFLERFLSIELNTVHIVAKSLPVAESASLPTVTREFERDGVTTELIAGLAERVGGEWNSDRAGWYVLCNGRVVVQADKTELTGWGLSGPRFVSTFRGFLGIAFFFSKNPADLPWTTTKRGLNLESPVYQAARKEMSGIAGPVLEFLRSMYLSDPTETKEARDLVSDLKPANISEVIDRGTSTFVPILSTRSKARSTTRVQFDAEKVDIDKIRKKISKPNWSAGAVGRHTFEYFLKMEFGE